MNRIVRLLSLLLCLEVPALPQAVPSPEKLLPTDTLGVFTVPDMAAARRLFRDQPQAQLWRDPVMAPFAKKFWEKFDQEWRRPLEREFGGSLTNLLNTAQGQVTLALTRSGWPVKPDAPAAVVLLVDAREQAGQLRELLADASEKLKARGAKVTAEEIGGAEFMMIEVALARPQNLTDLDAAEAGPDDARPRKFFVGQIGSLLLAGSERSDVEQILKHRAGGTAPTLATATAFQADFSTSFRAATAYGWLHLEPMLDVVTDTIGAAGAELPMGLDAGVILEAIGLKGLRTVAFAVTLGDGTTATEFKVRLPEADRKGLFRLLALATGDSTPPAAVPVDVVTFSRTRINLAKVWSSLEAMVSEVSPELGNLARLTLDSFGKDKDAKFDFRRQFVNNLGDDVITWQPAMKAGASTKPAGSAPQVTLIQSPKPDELVGALRLLLGMVPPDVAKLEESIVAGKKIWSISIPMGFPAAGQPPPPAQSIAFAAAGNYLIAASDRALVEQYLSKPTGGESSLLAKTGFREAAQQVGGLSTGLFGYANDRENMRASWTALISPDQAGANSAALLWQQLLAATASAGNFGDLQDWFDFALLPPFAQVERYFHFSVYSGAVDSEGFKFRQFAPRPPGH